MATHSFSGAIAVLLGNGDGTFSAARLTGGGLFAPTAWVAVGDFNGDGKLDLALAAPQSGRVSVVRGNGDGTFSGGTFYAMAAFSVAVGDFNGDGQLDLAGAGADVSVLLGNGDGTLAQAPFAGVGAFPVSVAVGDFNGDGAPDLATVYSASSRGSD